MKKKKILFALLIAISACLVFTVVHAQKNLPAGEPKITKTSEANAKPISEGKKILVVYFSRSGNTREIANQIHRIVGGDIVELQTVNPYPADYEEVKKQAKQEQGSGFRPKLKTAINNIGSYDLVFIGSPIWWSRLPPPVVTFLSEYDLSGKTIVPFCTHLGSGQGQTVSEISRLCPKSTLLDGIAVRGPDAKNAQDEVSGWLRKIKVTK